MVQEFTRAFEICQVHIFFFLSFFFGFCFGSTPKQEWEPIAMRFLFGESYKCITNRL
uniref:Uncharacterized protein n=1 Tax=Arundo donax TaxID=35708 RepID=A0A0A9FEQ6_ARUDO